MKISNGRCNIEIIPHLKRQSPAISIPNEYVYVFSCNFGECRFNIPANEVANSKDLIICLKIRANAVLVPDDGFRTDFATLIAFIESHRDEIEVMRLHAGI